MFHDVSYVYDKKVPLVGGSTGTELRHLPASHDEDDDECCYC